MNEKPLILNRTPYSTIIAMSQQCYCFGVWRGGVQAYVLIGKSLDGLKFFTKAKVVEQLGEAGDELHVWSVEKPVDGDKEMVELRWALATRELEQRLLEEHKPIGNLEVVTTMSKPCKQCTKMFPPNRHWQDFCCKECRDVWYKVQKERKKNEVENTCPHCQAKYVFYQNARVNLDNFCPECRSKMEP